MEGKSTSGNRDCPDKQACALRRRGFQHSQENKLIKSVEGCDPGCIAAFYTMANCNLVLNPIVNSMLASSSSLEGGGVNVVDDCRAVAKLSRTGRVLSAHSLPKFNELHWTSKDHAVRSVHSRHTVGRILYTPLSLTLVFLNIP